MEPAVVIGHVVPLALGAALSPAVLGASLELVAAFGKRGIRMLLLYLLGAAIVVAAVIAVASVLPQRHEAKPTGAQDVVTLALATVLVILALVLVFRHPASGSGSTGARLLGSRWASLGVFALGLFMMITNFSTLVLVLAGSREIESGLGNTGWRALGYLLLGLGALAPIVLPLVWMVVGGRTAMAQLQRLNAALATRARPIGIVVCLLTAAYLYARAFGIL